MVVTFSRKSWEQMDKILRHMFDNHETDFDSLLPVTERDRRWTEQLIWRLRGKGFVDFVEEGRSKGSIESQYNLTSNDRFRLTETGRSYAEQLSDEPVQNRKRRMTNGKVGMNETIQIVPRLDLPIVLEGLNLHEVLTAEHSVNNGHLVVVEPTDGKPLSDKILEYVKAERGRNFGDVLDHFQGYGKGSIVTALYSLRDVLEFPTRPHRKSRIIYNGPREASEFDESQMAKLEGFIRLKRRTTLTELEESFQLDDYTLQGMLSVLREKGLVGYKSWRKNAAITSTRPNANDPQFTYIMSDGVITVDIGLHTAEALAEDIHRLMGYNRRVGYSVDQLGGKTHISFFGSDEAVLDLRLEQEDGTAILKPFREIDSTETDIYSKGWHRLVSRLSPNVQVHNGNGSSAVAVVGTANRPSYEPADLTNHPYSQGSR